MPRLKFHANTLSFYCALLLAFAVCMIFCKLPLTSQTPPKPKSAQTVPRDSPGGRLIAEAEAADTGEGLQAYTQHLTKNFVSPRGVGNAYVDAFSQRLFTADLMARQGKRQWIPESVVAQAFNYMMAQTSGPSCKPLRTDTSTVHQLRIILSEVSPALSSVKSQVSKCLPTEAVDLMIQLLSRNGSLEDPCPPPRPGEHGCVQKVNADVLILRYSQSHSASENVMLFDHVAQLFGL